MQLKKNIIFYIYQVNNYTLDFTYASVIDGIALSRFTFDSELSIEESESNKTILNKTNLYYIFNNETTFNKNVTIKATKGEGCIIEFLSKFEKNDFNRKRIYKL